MSEPSLFRRPRVNEPQRDLRGMVVLLVLVGALILTRSAWLPSGPDGPIVEVTGEVPAPGTYAVADGTVGGAMRAAGGRGQSLQAVHDGDRVVVSANGVHVEPGGDPLLVGLPINVNEADVHALTVLPGVGAKTAAAIVADRDQHGPFGSLAALDRVAGVGPGTVERLAGLAVVE